MIHPKALRVFACATFIALIQSGCATAQISPPQETCGVRWGKPAAPLVATEQAARQIFLAVETDFNPRADLAYYPAITVVDEGMVWAVFRDRLPEPQADGSVVVIVGGGRLSLTIAKCDSEISKVHYSR